MFRTILDISAVTMTLTAAFFLARSSFTLSAADIAEMSQTQWDYTSSIVASLSRQQADARVGVFLLVLAFLFQSQNLLTPMKFNEIDNDPIVAVIAAIVSFAVVFLISRYVSHVISERTRQKVMRILFHQDREQQK